MMRVAERVEFQFRFQLLKLVYKKKESVKLLSTSRNATVDLLLLRSAEECALRGVLSYLQKTSIEVLK
jgi:hypothetical protein